MDALPPLSEFTARRRGGQWVVWLVAVGLLAFLFWRIPFQELQLAIRRGPWIALMLATAAQCGISFLADVTATQVGLAAVGLRRPFREILWVRGVARTSEVGGSGESGPQTLTVRFF